MLPALHGALQYYYSSVGIITGFLAACTMLSEYATLVLPQLSSYLTNQATTRKHLSTYVDASGRCVDTQMLQPEDKL